MPKYKPCSVKERQVQPCKFLTGALDLPTTRAGRRLVFHTLINRKTFKVTRSMVVLHSGAHRKSGIALNYCPFCAADIGSHIVQEPDNAG